MRTLVNLETISLILYWGAFALWGLLEGAGAFTRRRIAKRRDASDRDRGSIFLIIVCLWAGLCLAGFASQSVPQTRMNGDPAQAKVAAGIFILFGIFFRRYAIRTLGRYFTQDIAVSAEQPIVHSGPYRLIRHPAFTGTLIPVAGIMLEMANRLSLAAAVAGFLIGHVYRIRVEEQALIAFVGKPYEEYMRRTTRLIPSVF